MTIKYFKTSVWSHFNIQCCQWLSVVILRAMKWTYNLPFGCLDQELKYVIYVASPAWCTGVRDLAEAPEVVRSTGQQYD